jgi:hypothetical protein
MIAYSRAFASPSSMATWRLSARSVLLPTSIMMTSLPRSVRTSSIHLPTLRNEARFVMSYTMMATDESRM